MTSSPDALYTRARRGLLDTMRGSLRIFTVAIAVMVTACPAPTPVTDPSIGPLVNAPEIACTGDVSPLVVKLSALYPQWTSVAATASAAGKTPGCCAYAQSVNAYLSMIPPPADSHAASDAWETYRGASCGSACMRVGAACL